MQFIKHLIIKIIGLAVIFGIPALYFSAPYILGDNFVDVVSSATTVSADDVTGEYIVLINADYHKDEDVLKDWENFFLGESPIIFEDISCLVSSSDEAGTGFAKICQARLPENQMTLKEINGLLMVSKAEYGKFDIIIMSKEFANAYSINSPENINNIKTVFVSGK